jgi:predicted transcriptional regulator of viral defense system
LYIPSRRTKLERPAFAKAKATFRKHGRIMRMATAVQAGIHRNTLYAMRDAGVIEQLSRGLFRLADAPPLANPDLVTVARRVPRGVICLISALALHDLGTQIPHEVWLAVPRDSEPPRLDYPPIRVFRYADTAFTEGIEIKKTDDTPVRVYSREKTLADCFKYRNKVGLDTAVEALKAYKQQGRIDMDALMRYAQTCRVANVMRPYLEAVL